MATSVLSTIEEGVLQVTADAHFYIVDADERIAIDTGSRSERHLLEKFMKSAIPPESIKKVILTHAHYDHAGNFDFFPNAEIFMHKEEIKAFKDDPKGATMSEDLWKKLEVREIKPLPKKIAGLEVIHTPGHTKGSVCLWWEERKILFTGDTLFENGTGRVDLPTSDAEAMGPSLGKLVPYNHERICAGH
ncbi:MAG: MBL fold metallo-hydrolase [Candidatus Woesearchaeota archaeon]|jgi:glyoxylase-like metal-dependent hydrolase (beta-lactamase superfamily II)|nr:MBL fold metallo-hydrolase [Candidatus Woesearchaeota archaeon]MDP7181752.1 MBL fold metallo-hydrolase [Candidatus Woesearchaeota archaeon]MDP7198841.1 MBL fold metallo-hydrolase [Candidatus Woesearchaeota archaeon]MDP7467159.1 MBL fold metallo-hydrolase [Candidatus Woesearchaeota archaeon]MDP7647506.1 MBL fold metallo-hydrolase [Candidatus Woesearchaeota archaeon]|tara:strand:+ start:1146 stop:1715 length:570 start_codon:yes stop_codon:yes gene_type:complete